MKIRLLVVDDNCDFVDSLRAFLERQGFIVDGVNDEQTAMAFLANNHYSAVIADLRLTGSDESEGLRILECFKKKHLGGCAILISAFGNGEIRARAHAAGVDAYLEKPVSCPQILEKLAEYGVVAG